MVSTLSSVDLLVALDQRLAAFGVDDVPGADLADDSCPSARRDLSETFSVSTPSTSRVTSSNKSAFFILRMTGFRNFLPARQTTFPSLSGGGHVDGRLLDLEEILGGSPCSQLGLLVVAHGLALVEVVEQFLLSSGRWPEAERWTMNSPRTDPHVEDVLVVELKVDPRATVPTG